MADDASEDDLEPVEREFLEAFRAMSKEDQDAMARVIHSWVESGSKGLTMEKLQELMKLAKQLQ